jgi:HK97 gp10 family phage protein
MISFSATATTGEMDALMAHLDVRLQAAVNVTAQAIQARYEAEAPRDTGSMATSCYVATPDGSDYGARTAAADSINPKVAILPELAVPPAPGAVVGVAAEHAAFVEYGTSRMPARPTFTPAAEAARAKFPDLVQAAVWGGG